MIKRIALLHHYSMLILYRSWADFRLESTRFHLGSIWWVLEPILDMGVYYFVFGILLYGGDAQFLPYLLVGLVMWRLFSAGLLDASHVVYQQIALARQVRIPKLVFPLISLFTKFYNFLLSLVLLVVVLALCHHYPSIYWLGAIPTVAVMILFILGMALPLCAVIPFVPDLHKGLSHAVNIWFFASAIFYHVKDHPFEHYLRLNPMVLIISSARNGFMYNQWPVWSELGLIAGCSLIGIVVGVLLIRHFDAKYGKRVPV